MAAPMTYVPEHKTDDALFEEHIDAGDKFNAWANIPVEREGQGINQIAIIE
jgi:hypothetical protein